jgi:hypothetical protein
MSETIYIIALLSVICTVTSILSISVFMLTLLLCKVFKFSVNSYVKHKSTLWTVRNWSQQEKKIGELKAEIERLSNKGE